jgi:hypothetical protein
MSHKLYLGSLNKITGEYVYPRIANKKDNYICPHCNKDIILCKGKIVAPYFRHKVDSINPCYYYDKPSESQIHKDAKMLMKKILENKTPIQIIRKCISCTNDIEINLPEIKDGSLISIEYRFQYNDNTRIADVAHTFNNEIQSIYEICYKHQTSNENRPEPWVEINAISLINIANENINQNNLLKIKCIRTHQTCNCCVDLEIEKQKNIEIKRLKYIEIEKIKQKELEIENNKRIELEKIRQKELEIENNKRIELEKIRQKELEKIKQEELKKSIINGIENKKEQEKYQNRFKNELNVNSEYKSKVIYKNDNEEKINDTKTQSKIINFFIKKIA